VGILNFRSLAFKVTMIMLLFALAVGSLASYQYSEALKSSFTERFQLQLQDRVETTQILMDSEISELQNSVKRFAKSFQSQLENIPAEQVWQSVGPYLTDIATVTYFLSTNADLYAYPQSWQQNVARQLDLENSLYFNVVSQQPEEFPHGRWTQVYLDDELQQWLVTYVVPIFEQSEFTGVLGAGTDIDAIIKRYLQSSEGSDIHYFVYDGNKNIVYHQDYGASLLRQADATSGSGTSHGLIRQSLQEFVSNNKPDSGGAEFQEWGKKMYAASRKLKSNGWVLVAYQSEQSMLKAQLDATLNFVVMVSLWGVVSGLVLFACLKYQLSKRLSRTTVAVTKAGTGSFENFSSIRGQDEIDQLNHQINKMFVRVKSNLAEKDKAISNLKADVESNKALAQAVSYSDNAVIILELDFTISYVDTKSLAMLKAEREQLMGSRFFTYIHEHMAFISEQIVNEIRRKKSWHGELVLKDQKQGGQVWVNSTITPMRDDNSNVTKYVLSMQDISFIKDSQSKIEKLAYTDELTGLANRTFFIAQLEKLVEISKRGRYEFALLYFDVDDFKRVNDIHGHEAGDMLLCDVANRLSEHLRTEDVLARMGGDEFALILGGANNEQDVIKVANQILAMVNTPFEIRDREIQTGTSIGITMSMSDEKEAEVMLQHADLAMYEAKGGGKNTYHFYTEQLNEVAKERQVIETALHGAIKNEKFELYYQPKVNFIEKRLVGYEALIRWRDDDLGFVSPAKFIPIAEQSNLILKLGRWVIDKACEFAASLPEPVPVSINLSARQFESGNCASELRVSMERFAVAPENIELEITESHLMSDVEDAIRQLHTIKDLGVSISIDDFGTGYSSLSYLKRFPVDTLKIDRSFIKDIPGDISDVEITGAIIAMAQKLGLEVIAEGAETQEQIDFLKQNGCYNVQGYFFSKPLPEHEARVWQYQDR